MRKRGAIASAIFEIRLRDISFRVLSSYEVIGREPDATRNEKCLRVTPSRKLDAQYTYVDKFYLFGGDHLKVLYAPVGK